MSDGPDEIELRLLLEAIHERFDYDFRQYSSASVRRRVLQAMRALGCPSISALQGLVLHDARAFGALLEYLTVQVTDMFRDPLYFKALRDQVVPILHTYPSIKVWIAGCSTGEEIYSFAILLREEGLLERTILYGTDISASALAAAEAGVYPLDRMRAFTANHQASGAPRSLATYYTTSERFAVLDRSLRKNVLFSDHSLATDAVFAEVQVVSCRNVLIYFDRPLQDRAIGLFRDALSHRGFLGLGAKETLRFSSSEASFEPFAQDVRWYRRR